MNRVSGAPAGLAADARGLAALKYDAARNDPAAVREAAKQFEAIFMQELLKSMRNATLAALSLWLRSPLKMEVGALVRDPVKNVYATIYAHAQRGSSHNLGGDIESPHFSIR